MSVLGVAAMASALLGMQLYKKTRAKKNREPPDDVNVSQHFHIVPTTRKLSLRNPYGKPAPLALTRSGLKLLDGETFWDRPHNRSTFRQAQVGLFL